MKMNEVLNNKKKSEVLAEKLMEMITETLLNTNKLLKLLM